MAALTKKGTCSLKKNDLLLLLNLSFHSTAPRDLEVRLPQRRMFGKAPIDACTKHRHYLNFDMPQSGREGFSKYKVHRARALQALDGSLVMLSIKSEIF